MADRNSDVSPNKGDVNLDSGKNIPREISIAAIRRLIKTNPGKILTVKDFQEAAGTTRANKYITELIEEGVVRRKRPEDGERGHRYTYTWVDKTAPAEDILVDMPELLISDREYDQLHDAIDIYVNEKSGNMLDEYVIGVVLFRQWLKQKLDDAKEERKATVLDATNNSGKLEK